jgi:hypothetical protein
MWTSAGIDAMPMPCTAAADSWLMTARDPKIAAIAHERSSITRREASHGEAAPIRYDVSA